MPAAPRRSPASYALATAAVVAVAAAILLGVTAARLAGTEWVLEDLGGTGVLDRAQATLTFPKDYVASEKISGSGSCNRLMGGAKVAAGLITVGPLATTQMACAAAVMDQETRYLKALQAAERLVFDGPYLLLYAKGMEKPLRFIGKTGE